MYRRHTYLLLLPILLAVAGLTIIFNPVLVELFALVPSATMLRVVVALPWVRDLQGQGCGQFESSA